jgi:hypothetical protein
MLKPGTERKFPFAAALNGCGFLGLFLFILFYIDPPVIYSNNGFDLYSWVQYNIQDQSKGSAGFPETGTYNLELTRVFLREAFSRPGGFSYLAVCALTAVCHLPLSGTAAILLVALLIFWAFPRYIKNSGGPVLLINRWIPCVFIVLSCCRLDLYWFDFFIAIAGALVLTILFQKISVTAGAAAAGFLALFWLSYYLFQWASLLFLAFVLIHMALTRPRKMMPLGVVAAVSLAVFYVLENRCIPVENAIRWKEFITPPLWPIAVICYFPLVACGVRLQLQLLLPRKIRQRIGNPLIRTALLVLIVAAAFSASVSAPMMRDTRTLGRTLHYMLNGRWDAILKEDASSLFQSKSGALPKVLMANVVNRALYKTGRLGDDMFSYPQSHNYSESLLMLKSTLGCDFPCWAAGLDLYMDLGAVSIAEKVAGEMMENRGPPYPFLLEKRALIQSAKGNYEAATVFLHRLRGMPFYRREAAGLLARIENGTIALDERVSHLAACMDTVDYVLYDPPDDSVLNNLLNSNPGNRMAWEYLIAYYLLTGQPSKIIGEIGRYRDFGYTHLPASWDQALCISLRQDPAMNSATLPVLPRRETTECYERFLGTWAVHQDSRPASAAALEPSFGSTYFFYYVFGFVRGKMR